MNQNKCNLDGLQMNAIGALMTRRAREIATYASQLKNRPVKHFCGYFNNMRDWVKQTLDELEIIDCAAAGNPKDFDQSKYVDFVRKLEEQKEAENLALLPLFGANHGKQ